MQQRSEASRPITLTRHRSELGRWAWAVAAPHPALRPYVREYVGASEEVLQPVCRRELPADIAPVVINFGAPFRMVDSAASARTVLLRSFATGAFDTYALLETTGPYECVQINFTILGARLFLQQPLRPLVNREVALEDVLGGWARRLEEELYEAPTWAERFDLLDRVVLSRLEAACARVPDAVRSAWRRLVASAGQVGIAELVRDSGWSHKHFVAQFNEHIGLPPKALARVLRFGRAAELLRTSERGRLAEIAHACGYSDQAHFTRDFRAFAGVSPLSLLASRLPNRGGFVA